MVPAKPTRLCHRGDDASGVGVSHGTRDFRNGAAWEGAGKYPCPAAPGWAGREPPRWSWPRATVVTSHLNPSLSGHISDPCQEQGGKGGL